MDEDEKVMAGQAGAEADEVAAGAGEAPAPDAAPADPSTWASKQHVRTPALDLLHGALAYVPETGGWVRPERFVPRQLRALESCHAWHPGYYRALADCTAGVVVEFTTDAIRVSLEVRVDAPPRGTNVVLNDVRRWQGRDAGPYDGVGCVVDGRALPPALPDADGLVTFELDDPDAAPEPGLQRLPGMGENHHVVLYLPCIYPCSVRNVYSDGSYVRPVDAREELLVLGDSLSQGYVAYDPALAWSARLSRSMGLDLVNQGIGGQVFQPGTVAPLGGNVSPAAIVVEFGGNYRFEPCSPTQVSRDVRAYLDEVARAFPDVPTWVLTCTPRFEDFYATHPKSCADEVEGIVRAEAARHPQMRVAEGERLLERRRDLFADGTDHPGPSGQAMIAGRLGYVINSTREPEGFRRQMAAEFLAKAPECAFPLAETVRRGIGEVVLAEHDVVLLRVTDGSQMIWAASPSSARQAMGCLGRSGGVTCILGSRATARAVARAIGGKLRSCHLVTCPDSTPLPTDPAWTIRTLAPAHAAAIRSHYTHVEYLEPGELERALAAGEVLGAFSEGELCGFVGEHAGGAIGMLEVFEEHRREGWGTALLCAKVNQQLDAGLKPWAEIWPDNHASVALAESLGLTVAPADQMWFLG